MRVSALAALCLSACAIGAPPGFSKGDQWSVPMITPLENAPLLVPVTIDGKGPYLFAIDPDAPVTIVDSGVASETDALSTGMARYIDENDTGHPIRFIEVLSLQMGTLTVKNTQAILSNIGTFNVAGHQVRGVIGRNVLADSLVFGFDRATGMAYLATQKGFTPSKDAQEVDYELLADRLPDGMLAISRRLVTVNVDGTNRTLHFDFGDPSSQLRDKFADKLIHVPIKRSLVDEAGTHRDVDHGNVAQDVKLGPINAKNVLFIPYADKRWTDQDIDGTIGLQAIDGWQVWDNLSSSKLYFTPEAQVDAKTRIQRWGSQALDACADPACTKASVDVAQVGQTPVLNVTRDASVADTSEEVLLEARTSDGKPTGQPRFVVIFPPGETAAKIQVDNAYTGMSIGVLDANPFPRSCPAGVAGACIYSLAN